MRTIGLAIACFMMVHAPSHAQEPKRGAAAPLPAKSARVVPDPASGVSYAPMLERVIPTVVTVRVTSETLAPVDLTPGATVVTPRRIRARSGGSGVIVDAANGHILTNHHVIADAVAIEVVLSDGRLLPARLVGRDIGSDVAVLEVQERRLPQIPIGDSDRVRVGDVVAAVGNPFGLEGTATLGIVSATMRTEIGHEAFEDYFQIDAVINPGNSGGALINARGELVGINTATAGTVGNVGIGFAIPINMARVIKTEIIRTGRMRRGSPGLVVEDLSYERAAELMSGTNRGAIVTAVVPGSPAAAAGISPGAIVIEVAGKPVRGAAEFTTRVVTVPLGTMLSIVVRQNGADKRYELATVDTRLPAREFTFPVEMGAIAGLVASEIALGNPLYGDVRGAFVAGVAPDSPAARSGLAVGDVIVGVDDNNVRHLAHLVRWIDRAGMAYRLRIVRNGVPAWLRMSR
ncbi:MAG TPA: trypsin-like peptidase domain-containing protein [Hyphomicrobiaceae bacterium]|nr:trypsin-like peptidase domain-containing protein [Hyphomicrobiaceae bacterium]